jgi:hypothetical protein
VQIGQHITEFPGNFDHPALRQTPSLRGEFVFEVRSLDKIHHQIVTVPLTKAVKDGRNRRMFQLGERIGLAVKILDRPHTFFGVRKPVKDLLNGAAAVCQALIVCNVDHAHTTARQKALDTIPPGKEGTRLELTIFIAGHGTFLATH